MPKETGSVHLSDPWRSSDKESAWSVGEGRVRLRAVRGFRQAAGQSLSCSMQFRACRLLRGCMSLAACSATMCETAV
jgi:hypothetical protein